MRILGAIFRLLTLVLCLVPFTNTQQAAGALTPFVPVVPAPAGGAPVAPGSEDDDERETEDGKEKERVASPSRLPVREQTAILPPAHTTHQPIARVCTTPPVAADPFRNGLGTPYRC